MVTVLKGAILGDPKTGKSSFSSLLAPSSHSISLTDPATGSQIKFLLEESTEIKPKTVCAFLVYSVSSFSSFQSIESVYLPLVQSSLNPSSSFVIIIGTHSDSPNREVDPHEAEELAATNGAFHLEVSNTTKRNIELTLKLMRIRAFYLLKKHPELKNDEEPSLTNTATGSSVNMDIPLPIKDFSSIQSKKNRYDNKSFAESVFGSKEILAEKNMSFADMQISDESKEEEGPEISIDTLGSPSWHQKVPPLSIFPNGGYAQTERNYENINKILESGSSTERFKDPLMIIEVQLDRGVKKIEVFQDDTAFGIAERVLGKGIENLYIEGLADIVYRAVNEYIDQVRCVNVKRPLYKVKIAIGKKWGEIVVHEGDSLEEVARSYVVENSLPKSYESNIVKLLLEAGEKYYS